eukprot:CAMPEP_0183713792 /NCGR_PEP_ID=MMETSP0737-20130205/8542_1 /TAXON_ID=385413 /ORGANISM="Thalassiosira miniscula, Strain CCMP1093" /LENGTH=246 /DNA_ID=CAMNT_0025942633 /DNA_START=173 /DNA_END=913 /DNA_ORIENTATION=-
MTATPTPPPSNAPSANFISPALPSLVGPTVPTISPAPSTNRNYCGASQEDAQDRCEMVIPCPDGSHNVCLRGQSCYRITGQCGAASSTISNAISLAPAWAASSSSASPTNTLTDIHAFDRNTTNFCGIDFDDVVENCYKNRPCPTGSDEDCPVGQKCFPEIKEIAYANCNTPHPTVTLTPTDFVVTDSPTSLPTTELPTMEPTTAPTEDFYFGDEFNGGTGCPYMSSSFSQYAIVSFVLCGILMLL